MGNVLSAAVGMPTDPLAGGRHIEFVWNIVAEKP
jgi:hypothetical protein